MFGDDEINKTHVSNPQKTAQRYFSWSLYESDFWYVAVAIVSMVWTSRVSNLLGIVVLGLFWAMWLQNNHDRRYRSLLAYPYEWFIGTARSNYLWASNPQEVGLKRRWRQPPLTVMPYQTRWVNFEGREIGLIQKGRALSFVIAGDGSRLPSLETQLEKSQVEMLKEALKRAVQEVRGVEVTVSFVYRMRPVDVNDIADVYVQTLQQDVVFFESTPPKALVGIDRKHWADLTEADIGLPRSEWPNDVAKAIRTAFLHRLMMEQLPDVAMSNDRDTVMACVITVQQEPKVKKLQRKRSSSNDDLGRTQLIRIIKTAETRLKAWGVINLRILDLPELHRYLRGSWDVRNIEQYHTNAREGADLEVDLHHPQSYIRTSRESLDTDGTDHRVIKITSSFYDGVTPVFLRSLLATENGWVSYATISEWSRSTGEYRAKKTGADVRDALTDAIGKREANDPKARRRKEETAQRQEELMAEPFRTDFVTLICASDTDPARNQRRIDRLTSELEAMGYSVVPVSRKYLQLSNVLSATTGIKLV